jgi:2-keto-3-deoxy-L-rhamnonate aldolase RhmA
MNIVRKALLERRVTVGSWLQIGHPASAELLDGVGFDWLAIDCEHGIIDLETATAMMRAMNRAIPLVRVTENSAISIRRALDAGAGGVIIPMVNTPEEARRAVEAAKYAPTGNRGFGYCRANAYGYDFDNYLERANDEIAVIVQIEHTQAAQNIEQILRVEGVDGILVGPYDLTGSMGIPGQLENPKVKAILDRILEACLEAGKSAGIHDVRPTPDSVSHLIEEGFTFLAIGVDMVFMQTAAQNIIEFAREIGNDGMGKRQ